ncbi:MAG: hypothetical protein WCX79_01830 [Candidatus Paceibacterota bacterium]|jgi:hypothetical protein
MNEGKKISLKIFKETLNELEGKKGVSEILFRDLWLEKARSTSALTKNGWYTPPPDGIAILFGSDEDVERINFDSLRKKENWPSEKEIDWERGLLFAYSSFVDVKTGILGDFDITLYFGKDERVINHFRLCHKATREVIDELRLINSSKSLFETSQKIFSKYGLRNSVISVSDSVSLDLGHSVPMINPLDIQDRILSSELIEKIRSERKFINNHSDWLLNGEEQFTIEPQFLSIENDELPQVCLHYLVKKKKDGGLIISNENDELLREYGLLD